MGLLTEDQERYFRENGFLVYGRVLSDAELDELRVALDRVLRGESAAKPDASRNLLGNSEEVVIQVVNIWLAEPAFRKHLYHPVIVPIIAKLMNTDTVRVWHDQIQIKPPRIGGPTIWHQDHPYWPIIQPADLISAWVALEDATAENGCMRMVKRSYKWGPYPGGTIGNDPVTHSPTPKPDFIPKGETLEEVVCEVPAGHVVFHHCLTWHGAPPNRSEKNRPAIAVHYMPGYTRFVPTGHHLIENHVQVAPGEVLKGDYFPTVYENGRLLHPEGLFDPITT